MDELHGALKQYFLYLEKHCQLWEGVAKRGAKPMNAIQSLSAQLRAVSCLEEDSKLVEKFPDLKDATLFKIFMLLEKEVFSINDIVKEMEEANNKLNRLLRVVEKAAKGISSNESDSHSIVLLPKLLEWVGDSRQYYQALYSEMRIALYCLDFRDKTSISALRESFFEDKALKKHVSCCIAGGRVFISEISGAS